MRTAAILPVKSFSHAKQRLSGSVDDQLRRTLAAAMVGDVLDALAATGSIEATFVVTREPQAGEAALASRATVIADDSEAGQSAAAMLGVGRARAEGFERVLCVPGRLPGARRRRADGAARRPRRGAGPRWWCSPTATAPAPTACC